MEISFEHKKYSRPFLRPLITSHGVWPVREGLWVRATDSSGRMGFGEVAPLEGFCCESLAEAEGFLSENRDFIGRDGGLGIPDTLPCCQFAVSSAMAGLENDWGKNTRSRESLHVAGLLPSGKGAIERIDALLATGFTTFKWKMGVESLEAEQATARSIFERIQGRGILRLDANGGLSRDDFESWLRFLANYPVEFLEQPLPVGDEDLMIQMSNQSGVSIAFDESLASLRDLQKAVSQFPGGVLVIKPALIGNVHAFFEWRLRNPRVRCVYSSAFETSIGLENALRLAAWDVHSSEAAGFGTIPFFPKNDGFCSHELSPILQSANVGNGDLERIWNSL